MRNLLNIAVLIIFILFLAGCNSSNQQAGHASAYFDVKSFLENQIVLLSNLNPTVRKTIFSDGKSEIRSQNNINWKKELELFVQADINKPAYLNSYSISRPDSLSFVYILKSGETLPVQQLKIMLDSSSGKPRLVEALLLSRNKLYESQKNIDFHCKLISGKWTMVSYHIKGYQKLSMLDSSKFDIKGLISF